MFESLQEGLSSALKTLRGKGKLTESNMRDGLKLVEQALPSGAVNVTLLYPAATENVPDVMIVTPLPVTVPPPLFAPRARAHRDPVHRRATRVVGAEARLVFEDRCHAVQHRIHGCPRGFDLILACE